MVSKPSYADLYAQVAQVQYDTAAEGKAIVDEAVAKLQKLYSGLEEPPGLPPSGTKTQLNAIVQTMTGYSAALGYLAPPKAVDAPVE